MLSRRKFLKNSGGVGLLGLVPAASMADSLVPEDSKDVDGIQLRIPLNGYWDFSLDPDNEGFREKWFVSPGKINTWNQVQVPHTWQIEPDHAEYFGIAWYKKDFFVPAAWKDKTIRAEFEAVYHSARVWLNGQPVGEHLLKGYTAFFPDLTEAIRPDEVNTLVVQVNNTFDEHMLPRGHSYDWAADGGIIRPVSLHVTEPNFTKRIAIDPDLDIGSKKENIHTEVVLANESDHAVSLEVSYRIKEEKSAVVAAQLSAQRIHLAFFYYLNDIE